MNATTLLRIVFFLLHPGLGVLGLGLEIFSLFLCLLTGVLGGKPGPSSAFAANMHALHFPPNLTPFQISEGVPYGQRKTSVPGHSSHTTTGSRG